MKNFTVLAPLLGLILSLEAICAEESPAGEITGKLGDPAEVDPAPHLPTLAMIETEAADLTRIPKAAASLDLRHELAINLVRVAQRRRAGSKHDEARLAADHAYALILQLETEAAADSARLADLRELRAYVLADFMDDAPAAADLLRALTTDHPGRTNARETLARFDSTLAIIPDTAAPSRTAVQNNE